MLKSIFIDNYALIDKLEMEFQEGLSIITGETGAGKTILLGALGLLLGKRADTSVLKDKSRKCIVEGAFQINGYKLEAFFADNELDYSEETLIRREISNSGKSRAFINDTPVNLILLQELALSLVDVHSQHQNLLLNNERYICWIIDSYTQSLYILSNYKSAFQEYQNLKQSYYKARNSYQSDQENLDYISHQFNELREANLKENELIELEEEYKIVSHAEEIKSALEETAQLLENEEMGVIRNLKLMKDQLSRIGDHYSGAKETEERIQNLYVEIKDIADEVSSQFERMEFDPERMEQLHVRIDLLYTLLRKHKVNTIQNLIDIRNTLDDKLQKNASGDYELEKLSGELANAEMKVNDIAEELSGKRKKIFSEFEDKVLSLLHDLGMKNVQFTIHHEITDPGEDGIDKIQFLFSANTNIPVQSIARVASGGELSRLMLAIKYLISNSFGLPTIIFDEIDSGVSGEIADKVGNLIKHMSSNMQVINITHLPQVASKGDHHYLVYKAAVDGTTKTNIKQLDHTGRLNEIAKMLSGDSVSEAAIENAKVLLGQQ